MNQPKVDSELIKHKGIGMKSSCLKAFDLNLNEQPKNLSKTSEGSVSKVMRRKLTGGADPRVRHPSTGAQPQYAFGSRITPASPSNHNRENIAPPSTTRSDSTSKQENKSGLTRSHSFRNAPSPAPRRPLTSLKRSNTNCGTPMAAPRTKPMVALRATPRPAFGSTSSARPESRRSVVDNAATATTDTTRTSRPLVRRPSTNNRSHTRSSSATRVNPPSTSSSSKPTSGSLSRSNSVTKLNTSTGVSNAKPSAVINAQLKSNQTDGNTKLNQQRTSTNLPMSKPIIKSSNNVSNKPPVPLPRNNTTSTKPGNNLSRSNSSVKQNSKPVIIGLSRSNTLSKLPSNNTPLPGKTRVERKSSIKQRQPIQAVPLRPQTARPPSSTKPLPSTTRQPATARPMVRKVSSGARPIAPVGSESAQDTLKSLKASHAAKLKLSSASSTTKLVAAKAVLAPKAAVVKDDTIVVKTTVIENKTVDSNAVLVSSVKPVTKITDTPSDVTSNVTPTQNSNPNSTASSKDTHESTNESTSTTDGPSTTTPAANTCVVAPTTLSKSDDGVFVKPSCPPIKRLVETPSLSTKSSTPVVEVDVVSKENAIHSKYLSASKPDPVQSVSASISSADPTPPLPQTANQENIHKQPKSSSVFQDGNKFSPEENQISINDFEVGKSLGSGRSGHVYMARLKKNGFICALKLVYKNSLDNAKAKDQLYREVNIQFKLRHPHILRLFTYFEDDKRVFLVLEYAPKGELYAYLKECGRFDDRQAAKYIKQMASALIYCQRNNVIHRDIKPENILINKNGDLKIADFGWSVQSENESRQTLCGTIDYIPPEMLTGKDYNDAVDRWSLGVLLYEFLVGSAPFLAPERDETFNRIKQIDLKIPYFVSTEATYIISNLLKYNPEERMTLEDLVIHPWINQT